jgi:hypothetical protein
MSFTRCWQAVDYRSPVLASVLPGVREVRVPLAAGLLWLLSGWLLFAPVVLDQEPESESDSFLGRISRLVDFFGVGGAVAAVLFTAYLVGIIVAFERVSLGGTPSKLTGLMAPSTFTHLQNYLSVELRKAVRELNEGGTWVGPEHSADNAGRDRHTRSIFSTEIAYDLFREEAALANRLRMQANKEVYQSYDAKIAEANFRQAVSLPLAALIIVVATNVSFLWLGALVVPVILIVLSVSARKEARSELIEAVIGELIESTTIQDFRDAAEGDVPRLHSLLKGQWGSYEPHDPPQEA